MHGSLVNRLMDSSHSLTPVVGMGATELCWSDRHAHTIVSVSASGRRIGVQRDIATRTDSNGMSDQQEYSFAPDAQAPIDTYSLRRNGKWVKLGDSMWNGNALAIGERSEYYDYGF